MNGWEKILLAFAVTGIALIVIGHEWHKTGKALSTDIETPPPPQPQGAIANGVVGPAYLTSNAPDLFNPGPPVYNVLPQQAQAVSTQSVGIGCGC